MLRLLGLLLLAGAFVLWRKNAEAAVTGLDLPSSDPAMPDNPAVPAGPLGFLAIVHQINQDEFGGWFDPALVMGVMQTESSFNPRAYRYESALGEASYGLMQLLESTARDRGLIGAADQLYDPALNIRLGMRQLKWSYDYLAQRAGTFTELQWISSYNGGVGNVLKGWASQPYYGKVMAAAAQWRGVA